jgi:nitrate/nitrite-specific signal transduction histidine kinase
MLAMVYSKSLYHFITYIDICFPRGYSQFEKKHVSENIVQMAMRTTIVYAVKTVIYVCKAKLIKPSCTLGTIEKIRIRKEGPTQQKAHQVTAGKCWGFSCCINVTVFTYVFMLG